MNAIMRSFVMGMLPGAVSRAQFPAAQSEQPEKEPICFLYGHVAQEGETPTHTIDGVGYVGAVLPDIYSVYTPELQKTHPYAVIGWSVKYYLLVFDAEPNYANNKLQFATAYNSMTIPCNVGAGASVNDGEWLIGEASYKEQATDSISLDLKWANFALLNEDNTVYIEPIPVYE